MALDRIPRYQELLDMAVGPRDLLDDDTMNDETRQTSIKKALNVLKGSFNESDYGFAIHLLMRNPTYQNRLGNLGEMSLQQFIYPVFSFLLLAACFDQDEDYKADQTVTLSLSCKFREAEEISWKPGDFQAKPDAASTISSGCNPFAMMELKQKNPALADVLFDKEKCIAFLSSTLISLERHGMDTSALYLPFIIGDGLKASLYVVHLDEKGDDGEVIPKVLAVEPAHFDLAIDRKRLQLFISLAALLHNAKTIFQQNDAFENYRQQSRSQYKETFEKYENPLSKKQKSSNSGSGQKRKSSNSRSGRKRGNENENLALQAARCDGLFERIDFPWPLPLLIGEDVTPEYQEISPYYFVGHYRNTGEKCFLKIWREDEEGYGEDARKEFRLLQRAHNHGVRVAKPITDDVVSTSVTGIKFDVLATEYIVDSPVSSIVELCDFSLSLMTVVRELHEKAGILHCDIKPNNLRWHSERWQVYLIDFGHAQLIEGARHYRATEGFEAPEIRETKTSHSCETDTYSVGATILWACDNYTRRLSLREDGLGSRMEKLRLVGEQLSAPLPDRMSLNHAIDELTKTFEECKHGDDSFSSSIGKRPRLEDPGSNILCN